MECGPEKCPIRVFSDLTPAEQRVERKRVAKQMMEQGFTQQQIAKQLGVSRVTIANDLANLSVSDKLKPTKTASNPKGAGRPKGSKRGPKVKQTDAVKTKIIALSDQGMSSIKIGADLGIDDRAVRHEIEREEIRREAQAEPIIDRNELSLSAQQKLDLAIRQHTQKLDLKFVHMVMEEVRRRIDEMVLPTWKERIDEAKSLFSHRKGAMDKVTFNKIRRALHPDSRKSISDKFLAEAFDTFMSLEKFLLDEKDSPTDIPDIPSSLAEWDRMKAKRSVSRHNGKSMVNRPS